MSINYQASLVRDLEGIIIFVPFLSESGEQFEIMTAHYQRKYRTILYELLLKHQLQTPLMLLISHLKMKFATMTIPHVMHGPT